MNTKLIEAIKLHEELMVQIAEIDIFIESWYCEVCEKTNLDVFSLYQCEVCHKILNSCCVGTTNIDDNDSDILHVKCTKCEEVSKKIDQVCSRE